MEGREKNEWEDHHNKDKIGLITRFKENKFHYNKIKNSEEQKCFGLSSFKP